MDREIPAEVKKQKMLKRLLRLAVTGTAATAALLILSRVLGNDLHENELFIRKVDRGPIEISVSASGKLMPLQEEIIVTPINTRILEVYKNPGDSVDKGDPLLKLELASVETEYRQKLDEREMMKSKLEQARVRLNGTISELEMQRRVKSMQAKQLYTDLQDERYLDSIGAGTPDKIRRAELNYEETKLELQLLEQKIENEHKNARAELRVQELELGILDKTLEEKARLLKDARILSPRKATLTFINRQIGSQVPQGTQVAVVSDLTRLKVDCEIGDQHREKLSVGAKAVIKTGDTELRGTVVTVTPSVTNGIVYFTVVPDEADHPGLRSGLSVDIHVLYGLRQNVLRIPNGTFFKYGPGLYDLWIVREGRAEKREVSLGESSYEYVEITDGLNEGDRVILSDMERYKDKQTLKIRKN
ncbi:HlyD family efflux transporter periplasmic adaptor subunit [Alistipes sp. AF17-16]|jgi:efflux transporter, RND family, MFP subunit|uniref:HlyD family efflux transporter periplasmic adaptor subunit n=2 Tax=Rikenellaceae TaxID=171550 RepID=A0ABR7CNR8_9BACT|nr:HlyD family efflux transporter periplasmic adaptor subunit [Alistipes hominis]MBS1414907.1 HlyD family efflux transporter periplasmic adaptor subunit [Alistipes sp.]RHR64513.1 HlyD family efflux transporter periplasmic adaptor subunit [Alistipes sp. AF17-16]